MKKRNLAGQIFHSLTAIKPIKSSRSGKVIWLCSCTCGNQKAISCDHLTRKINPVKSCGCCQYRKGKYHAQFKGYEGLTAGWWNAHVTRQRKNTKRPPIKISLTIEEGWNLLVQQNFCCALSGIPIIIASNSTVNTASIDRIDSSKGYELTNIQWVHKDVNFMKRTYTQKYFLELCKSIAKHNEVT